MQLRRAVIADMEQLKALYFNTILLLTQRIIVKYKSMYGRQPQTEPKSEEEYKNKIFM